MSTLGELLKNWGSAYNSVDVRSAYGPRSPDQYRRHLYTVVRFSREFVPEVQARQSLVTDRYGDVDTEGLKIEFQAIEWTGDWSDLLKDVEPYAGWIDEFFPEITNANILMDKSASIRLHWAHDWPVLFGHQWSGATTLGQELPNDVDRQLIRAGTPFTNAISALQSLLEIEELGNNQSPGLVFVLPVYGRIDSLEFKPGRVSVTVSYDENFGNLSLYLNRYRSGQRNLPLTLIRPVQIGPEDTRASNGILVWSNSWTVTDLAEDDEVDAQLFDTAQGIKIAEKRDSQKYYKQRLATGRNPLASLFPDFCDWNTLEELLTNPAGEAAKALATRDKGRALVFETAVDKLLSLLGFVVVHLGKWGFEQHKGNPQASIDILAWHPGASSLCLVGCTTGDPTPGDINTLLRVHESVSDSLRVAGINVVVNPFLFCSVRAPASEGINLGVRVFDGPVIREFVKALQDGEVQGILIDKFRLPWDRSRHPTGV